MKPGREAAASGGWLDHALMALVFTTAALVRFPRLKVEVYGDEALYYYLAKTFGHDRHWVDFADNTWSQIAYRPLIFALYFPVAQLGLTPVRICNTLLGCAITSGVYALSRAFGALRMTALIAAMFVALHPMAGQFSVVFFPDNTTTAFMLLAIAAAAKGRYGHAAVAMTAAVLCKEASIAVAAGLLAAALLTRWARSPDAHPPKLSAVFKLSMPFLAFIVSQFIGMVLLRGRMQGWSHNPITTAYLSQALLGPAFVPFAVILALKHRWFALLPTLGLAAFYVVWAGLAGRGVEGWYQVSMISLASVSLAAGAAEWLAAVPATWSRLRRAALSGLAHVALAALAPWSVWLGRAVMPWDATRPDEKAAVAEVIQKNRPRHVALAACEWSHAYYPWRPPQTRVTRWYHPANDFSQIPSSVISADIAVLCGVDAQAFRRVKRGRKGCSLLSTEQYEVIRDPKRCLPTAGNIEGKRQAQEYRASDLRHDTCVGIEGDMTLRGHGCVPKIVAFGPYVDVAEGSLVDVSFEFRGERDAKVSLEVAGDLGRQSYGGATLEVRAGEPRSMHLQLQLPHAARGLESRIAVQGTADFEIDDFLLVVR